MELTKKLGIKDVGKVASILSYFTIIGWLVAYFGFHQKKQKNNFGQLSAKANPSSSYCLYDRYIGVALPFRFNLDFRWYFFIIVLYQAFSICVFCSLDNWSDRCY